MSEYALEAAPEMDGFEWESAESGEWESEAAEAARRRRQPARPGRYTPPPQRQGFVTQAQFQSALDKVRGDVAQNARAISSVGTQMDALSKRTRTELKTLRDETTRTRDETRNTLQTLAVLPLLASGGTATVMNTATPSVPVTVATPPDSLTQLLPLLLLSGSFGGGMTGSGGSSSGGMDSGLMLAVALIAAHH
jgi:hypothetical protein